MSSAPATFDERLRAARSRVDILQAIAEALAAVPIALEPDLAAIVGPQGAERACGALAAALLGETELEHPWRAGLEAGRDSIPDQAFGAASLFEVSAFAEYGIVPGPLADREARLRAAIQTAWPICQWLTTKLRCLEEDAPINRFMRAAVARLELDSGTPVLPSGLALLAGVSEGRIRNMISARELASEAGRVPAEAALSFLSARQGFVPSIWRDAQEPVAEAEPAKVGEFLFVPVAQDGSVFHPGLERSGAFAIGAKGEERQIPDFREALGELQAMATPRWRRPNSAGNWGIVTAVRWIRVDESELAAQQPRV